MRARTLPSLLLALVLVSAGSCVGNVQTRDDDGGEVPASERSSRAVVSAADADVREAEIQSLTDHLMARARATQPGVSARLERIAAEQGGRLAGFEYRLKSRSSLVDKVRNILHDHPDWTPSDVVIDDALRYTLEVEDVPVGRHAAAIRAALAALEAAGHHVLVVKNYWPRGDNYSGVNSVLMAPGGMEWELQFHTAESFRLKMRDHHLYEELREEGTARARKRQLYLELAAPWKSVPIPAHMLDPKALHPTERIILRPPP